MTTIGRRLRQLRTLRGYNLETVAKMTGISVWTLSQHESGAKMPSWNHLAKLGALYMISPQEMFKLVNTWKLKNKEEEQ